jgi:biotin carboxyl carrier protein
MNYQVKIGDRIYAVEIRDINARPVTAIVNGRAIEVWPGTVPTEASAMIAKPAPPEEAQVSVVFAPMPGVITAVSVKSGDQVDYGQELCVLEAMKMKNSIRAPRSGKIKQVHVGAGQSVKFHDPLVEFQE